MSFERARYDVCAYNRHVADSMASAGYGITRPVIQEEGVFIEEPGIQMGQNTIPGNRMSAVSDESDLLNLGRPLSECNTSQYKPACSLPTEDDGYPCGTSQLAQNPKQVRFNSENTRLSDPVSNSRGAFVTDHFDPLIYDPQSRLFPPHSNQKWNISNRLVVKDNHRPCIPVPRVNSMKPPVKKGGLPIPRVNPNTPGVFTDPMYVYGVCGENQ